MTYPASVVIRPVQIGSAVSAVSGRVLTARTVTTASRSLIHLPSGARLEKVVEDRTANYTGEPIWWEIATTDQSNTYLDGETREMIVLGPDEHTHLYTTTLTIRDGADLVAEYVVGPYPVPTDGGSLLDLDTMLIPDETAEGELVTVPSAWGDIVADAANMLGLFPRKTTLITNVKEFGAVGDGLTNDAAAAAAAAAAAPVVLYPPGVYVGAGAYGNAYSASSYKDALGERFMAGLPAAPIADARPVMWVQKHSNATRASNPQEWDNGAVYAALIKESGDAYGAALTGFARHNSDDSGDLIGVHGRGLATKTASKVWGGWMYAASVNDAAATYPRGLAGLEVNVSHRGTDTGWSSATAENQQHGLLVMAADGAKVATRAIAVGRANSPDGSFHTGLLVSGTAITPVDAATDFAAAIGNNEAILLTGNPGRHNGIRFHAGSFGVGVSFAEASFRSGVAMLMGTHQRIGVGAGPSTPAVVEFVNDDSSNRYVNLLNMLVRINGTQVVGPRRTGWVMPTGTASRATFATSTVTLPELAGRVMALIADLRTHGLIGD